MSNIVLLIIYLENLADQVKKINGHKLQEKYIKDHQIKYLDNQNNVEKDG